PPASSPSRRATRCGRAPRSSPPRRCSSHGARTGAARRHPPRRRASHEHAGASRGIALERVRDRSRATGPRGAAGGPRHRFVAHDRDRLRRGGRVRREDHGRALAAHGAVEDGRRFRELRGRASCRRGDFEGPPMKRVAVTGIGVISPLGNDPATFFAALLAGRSAIARLEGRFHERLACPIGAAATFDGATHFDAAKLRMLDRVSQFALAAAAQAIADAQGVLEGIDHSRAGVFVGTGMGGAQSVDDGYHALYAEASDRLKPFTVLLSMTNAPGAWIGLEHGFTGANLTYSTACSSSAVAIGEAARRIAHGEADVMIA